MITHNSNKASVTRDIGVTRAGMLIVSMCLEHCYTECDVTCWFSVLHSIYIFYLTNAFRHLRFKFHYLIFDIVLGDKTLHMMRKQKYEKVRICTIVHTPIYMYVLYNGKIIEVVSTLSIEFIENLKLAQIKNEQRYVPHTPI